MSAKKVMICVPTLDKIDASFFTSVLGLEYDVGCNFTYNVKSNSLIYNARNDFALDAINGKFDYLVFFDSDLVLQPETLTWLIWGITEQDADLVTGLYFKRKLPTSPVILKHLDWYEHDTLGPQDEAEVYEDYPTNRLFEVAGCGMGCCIMKVDMLREVTTAFRMAPFTPMPRLSEDYAFCWRMGKAGKKLICDPRIQPKHAGLWLYGEADWTRQKEAQRNAELHL